MSRSDESKSANHQTRPSLLSGMRLSKDDSRRKKSLDEFFRTYQPRLKAFFLRKGIQEHDADDLASDLILRLLKRMEDLKYDPKERFRSYLDTCAQNALKQFWSEQNKRKIAGSNQLDDQMDREELQKRLSEQFDLDLFEEAKRIARENVSDRDWQVFVELTESATGVDELATKYEMARNAVDMVKYRIMNRIKSAVKKLEQRGFLEE